MMVKQFPVRGMTCASCAVSLETYVGLLPGVKSLSVNYPTESIEVSYDESTLMLDQLVAKAKEIGYDIVISEDDDDQVSHAIDKLSLLRKKLIVALIFSTPIFILSMFFHNAIPYQNVVLFFLTIPVLWYSGADFLKNAWTRLKHWTTNMDTLVALSTGIAFVFSTINTFWPSLLDVGGGSHVYYESAVVIISFILLGKYLEERAKNKTAEAIKQLIGLTPNTCFVIRNGAEIELPTKDILKGDLVVVKPGDKIPVDGKVKRGETYVDESMVTGEPVAVPKLKGDHVIAGTVNQQGSIRILAEKVGSQTVIAEIIELVKRAQNSKPAIQKWVDKIASIFVPIVIGIALLASIVWLWFGPPPALTYAITTSITVLIVACPCALGLATPTALMVGIGLGSKNGILIRDAQALETLHTSDIIILDKTGTLTKGKPEVMKSVWRNEQASEAMIQVLKSIVTESSHPLSNSISSFYQNVEKRTITSFENIVGQGVKAVIDDAQYFVGNAHLATAKDQQFTPLLNDTLNRWSTEPYSMVYFSNEKEVLAIFAIGDTIKDNASTFIKEMKQLGIEPIVLSGDTEAAVSHVAEALGIAQFAGHQSPGDKADRIRLLQAKGHKVTMVGDGINDAGALAQADIGIAMGSGTDIAMESAGVTLMHSDLSHLVKALKLSKATIKTVKQNLFWAFIYNLLAIPLAAGLLYPVNGFLLHPMIAGAAMSFSSVSVLLNSLRLKATKI